MPIYLFRCKKCKHEYETLMRMGDLSDKKAMRKVKCTECKSTSKEQLVANVNFQFSQPVGTDRYNNSHDYRFKHGYHKEGGVKDQRAQAEALSHMGSDPYQDTSQKDIELDTGIHDVHERPGLS